jgi:hypothetical protein
VRCVERARRLRKKLRALGQFKARLFTPVQFIVKTKVAHTWRLELCTLAEKGKGGVAMNYSVDTY